MLRALAALPRPVKKLIMVLMDLVLLPLAVWAAFALRLGEPLPPHLFRFWWLLPVVPLLTVPVLVRLELYRAVVRQMGPQAMLAVLKGVTISTLLMALVTVMASAPGLPRSVLVLYWMLALVLLGGSRFIACMLFQTVGLSNPRKERVVIYGAGAAGLQSAAALRHGNEYEPVAFVDDNPSLCGSVLQGLLVHAPAELPAVIVDRHASHILLAMPSVPRSRRRQILARLDSLPVHVKTLPGLADLVSGQARVDEFREVEIEDLLGRDPVAPDLDLLKACIEDKAVLVTGAGGSIGGELCRQILRNGPTHLLLYEVSEFGLYRIERELRTAIQAESLEVELVPLLGSVGQGKRLQRVMETFAVDTVYHAAAYKHVSIVEHNVIEGVHNNVFGTLRCAEAAIAAGVSSFVLVSTDKAVRPTSVMGASKRMAELVLQGLAARQGGTCFTMVRFGNVLGSSGSVVPLFREQIRQGGPVTVTHPEVIRYFMTIPEAALLVIQAGSMGQGGDVFVLNMGEPVRIIDLARRMIQLMGFQVRDEHSPDGDVEVRFTGLRPGEKLYEELLIDEGVTATQHPMIMSARETSPRWAEIRAILADMDRACQDFDCDAVRRLLLRAVAGYKVRGDIEDLVWKAERGAPSKIAALPGSGVPELWGQV
ncbi:MAG: polysaccharide biosynthesis protein [Nitrococcus sp.]|nr:polysaccharide biosynthesis protein [Nitrococcus sp.]